MFTRTYLCYNNNDNFLILALRTCIHSFVFNVVLDILSRRVQQQFLVMNNIKSSKHASLEIVYFNGYDTQL